MINPQEKHYVLSFVPWLLGMLTYELVSIEGDPDIDPQYYNGFKDCLETVKIYTHRYLGNKVWGNLEADVKEYMEKGGGGVTRKKQTYRRKNTIDVLL